MILRYLVLITLIAFVFGKPKPYTIDGPIDFDEVEPPKCGYDSCQPGKPGMLNVHLVAHTHDDVGWLKTVDQYFYGSKSNIQKAGVEYILDSVVQELIKDHTKKFIYVETAYLWKWWRKQHDTVRYQVKKLINRGQLEIIGGGWTMNDEAVTHYQSIIDQFTWGLRKLNETFGDCGRPRVGWQIDPFGHSREMASLFAQMGYDGMLFGRLDYQDKRQRLKTKTGEMVWQGSANLGNVSQLFTSMLYNNYAPPPGFCFDVLCDDEPIINDKRSPDYNVDAKVKEFVKYCQQQATSYKTSNIILTMGEDFNYQDAHMWFLNLDKLISYVNNSTNNVNLMYSTPSCYLKAVHDDNVNRKWPVKYDDFFPYGSDPNTYWTGYFTSRPTLKRFERLGNNYLQVCKQLYALTDLGPEDWVDLNMMREAMGVMQHHDAVTGTEKEHVAHDYARLLSKGFEECDIITKTALNKIMTAKKVDVFDAPTLPLESCLLLNISQCDMSEITKNFVVTVYNPLSRPVSHYVRLPVPGKAYTVTDPNGMDLTVQLTPIPEPVLTIPGRMSEATAELTFHASDLPPLGYKSYFVKQGGSVMGDITLQPDTSSNKFKLSNGNIVVKLNRHGLLSSVKINGQSLTVQQDYLWYEGAAGNNKEFKNRSSGAYIFRPNGSVHDLTDHFKTVTYKGPLCQEMHQQFNDYVSQVIRIYDQENYVETEWLVGPIPTKDHVGKEIINRFSTQLESEGTFYTDSNGREILKRVRNFRPTWKLSVFEPVSANYYPVTSKIFIRDEKKNIEFAVLTDRAQGGSSLKDGQIELMIHRQLLHDDAFGVDEALNEKAFGKGLVARGSHYLIGGPYKNASGSSVAVVEKDVAQRKLLSAWTFISPIGDSSYQHFKNQYVMQFSGLTQALPKNIQILTLEPWKARSFLLRLEHVYEKDEDPELSKPVSVNIKGLFTPFKIVSARETTLGANQWSDQNDRLRWKTGKSLENYSDDNEFTDRFEEYMSTNSNETNEVMNDRSYDAETDIDNAIIKELDRLDTLKYTFEPMQIRTFVIDIEKV